MSEWFGVSASNMYVKVLILKKYIWGQLFQVFRVFLVWQESFAKITFIDASYRNKVNSQMLRNLQGFE